MLPNRRARRRQRKQPKIIQRLVNGDKLPSREYQVKIVDSKAIRNKLFLFYEVIENATK